MNRPLSRRTLLASVATTTAIATGGFESDASDDTEPSLESKLLPTDRYECSNVDRPEPDPRTQGDLVACVD